MFKKRGCFPILSQGELLDVFNNLKGAIERVQ
jgi:hypothetical protein